MLLAKGYYQNPKKLVVWSDCGGHYRSTQSVAWAAAAGLARWKPKNSLFTIKLKWGLECHCKFGVDRWFSQLGQRITTALTTPQCKMCECV